MKRCLETSPPACSSPVPAVGVQQFSIERVPSSPRSPVLLDELPIARNQGASWPRRAQHRAPRSAGKSKSVDPTSWSRTSAARRGGGRNAQRVSRPDSSRRG